MAVSTTSAPPTAWDWRRRSRDEPACAPARWGARGAGRVAGGAPRARIPPEADRATVVATATGVVGRGDRPTGAVAGRSRSKLPARASGARRSPGLAGRHRDVLVEAQRRRGCRVGADPRGEAQNPVHFLPGRVCARLRVLRYRAHAIRP